MKDDRFYLIRVAEDIARIEKFTADGETAFLASELIQGAVLRYLQTLGSPSNDFQFLAHPISRCGLEGGLWLCEMFWSMTTWKSI